LAKAAIGPPGRAMKAQCRSPSSLCPEPIQRSEIQQFLQVSLCAIVRAEAQGRLPARFTGTGVAIWETFRNELTPADLVALCVQDAGVTMPIPLDPGR
jgi:hypothetical protein